MNFSDARPVKQDFAILPKGEEHIQPPLIRELLGVVARRRLTIFGMIALVCTWAIVFLVTVAPKYTATATVLLDTKRIPAFQVDQNNGAEGPVDAAAVESQVATIKSEKIFSQVIKKFNLTHDPEFRAPPPGLVASVIGFFDNVFGSSDRKSDVPPDEDPELAAATRIFNGNLAVTHVPRTYIVEIAYTSLNKQTAQKLANGAAESYINDQLEAKYEVTRRAGLWLQQRIEELRQQASDAYKAVQDFKTENNIIVDTKGKLGTDREVDELTDGLARARTELSNAESKLQRIQQILKEGNPIGSPDQTLADILNNPIITKLRGQYIDARKREEDWAARYGQNHLSTVSMRSEMAALERAILSEVQRIAESYKSDVEIKRAEVNLSEGRLNDLFQRASSTRQLQIRLRELETQAASYQTIYETFLNRYTQTIQETPTTEARVITSAALPDSKSWPKTTMTLFLSLLAGTALGVGAALTQEHLDRVLRTRQQLEGVIGIDCLGFISHQEGSGLILTDDRDPFSQVAEALRAVKVAIDINQFHKKTNVIGIVSVFPGEGKTTCSANLASIIGKSGRKTLLIDGDLRNPSLTRSLGDGRQPGLIEAMGAVRTIEECVRKNPSLGFDLLGGTLQARLAHSADILSSARMKDLIETVRHDYEYVIIDLPPLLPLADVRAAAHLIDSFILVVKWGSTTIDDVKDSLSKSPTLSERLIGAVLNNVDVKTMRRFEGYSRRSVAYYYGDAAAYTKPNHV
jgi:capsular exopolysaccharide synthesis family protein